MKSINARSDIANTQIDLKHIDPQSMLSFDDKRKYFMGLSVESVNLFKGSFVALVTKAFENGTKLDETLYKKLAKEALIQILNVEEGKLSDGSSQVNTSAVKTRKNLKSTNNVESHNLEKPEPSELVKARKNLNHTGNRKKPPVPPKPDHLKKK